MLGFFLFTEFSKLCQIYIPNFNKQKKYMSNRDGASITKIILVCNFKEGIF